MNGGLCELQSGKSRESRNGRVRGRGRALYKQALIHLTVKPELSDTFGTLASVRLIQGVHLIQVLINCETIVNYTSTFIYPHTLHALLQTFRNWPLRVEFREHALGSR